MARKKKHGRATKKLKLAPADVAEEQFKGAPHTFVINRGNVGKNVSHLIRDVRKIMEPYTATKLKTKKKNVLKDFLNIAGTLHVTHMMTFSKTESTTNMRIMRLPRGPTLTFRVRSYSLAKDVLSSLKRPNIEEKQFLNSPLLVMNNFAGEDMHFKLMTSMFQNMFPSINVNKAKLREIKRCLLMNYNAEDQTIDIRHFNIKAVPAGMSRGVKKLIKSKIPNMGKYEDFAEYLTKGGDPSESEAEQDGPHNVVVLPQSMPGKGNIASAKSAIRLTEIGPRLKLQLIKIEEGICDGKVLYHALIKKTDEELEELKVLREKKKLLKAQRKKQQEENVKKKEEEKEELKKKSLAGMKGHKEEGDEEEEGEGKEPESEEDDDVEYFKEAVGENPDPDLFSGKNTKRKRQSSNMNKLPFKKKKFSNNSDSVGSGNKFKGKGDKQQFEAKGSKQFQAKGGKQFQTKGQKRHDDDFKKPNKGNKVNKRMRKGGRRQPGKPKQRRKK